MVSSQESTTFKLIHRYQQIIFMFIRVHRERKFELMVTLLSLFFSIHHQNYARWPPIHIRDLEVLPDSTHVEFNKGYWTITRRSRRFSSIPIDHAHEQATKRVKRVGGMIGLTDNPDMLERWIMTGPEISRVVDEFTGANDNDDDEELLHHEDRCACHRIRQ